MAATESRPRLLDRKGLAAHISVPEGTIRGWVLRRQVPFVKLNGRVLFPLDEVEAWISRQMIPPASEVMGRMRSAAGLLGDSMA